MARHLVCLTFDFDAVSSWIYRGMTTPTPMSRGEFGVVAAGRILDLLDARGLASTWFVPGHTLDHWPDVCRRVHAAGHEIGHHGYLHEPPAALSTRSLNTCACPWWPISWPAAAIAVTSSGQSVAISPGT